MGVNEILVSLLTELRDASAAIGPDVNDAGASLLMRKYGMPFYGSHLNVVYAHDVCALVNERLGQSVESSVIMSELPSVCASLSMNCSRLVPLRSAGSTDSPSLDYSIRLY